MLEYARFIEDRSAILVYPRQPYLDWCKKTGGAGSAVKTYEYLRKYPMLFLLPEFKRGNEKNRIRKQAWPEIFALLLNNWRSETSTWPRDWTYEMFREWFDFKQLNWVADLVGDEEFELEKFRTDPHAQLGDFLAGAEPRAPEIAGVPSRIELNPDGTPDGQWIEERYFGLDLSAAEQLYSDGLLNETEALVFMGPVALAFYWQAVDAYCRSAQSAGDEYVLSLDRVLERFISPPLSQDPKALRRALQTAGYVLEHWSSFESASSFYFPSRLRWQEIQSKLQFLVMG